MSSPIGFLAGVWHGTGTGDYPTMPPFRYAEEVRFIPLLESVLMYQQTAWSADDGEVLHFESGIWRSTDTGDLAVTISLPRVAEVAEGRIEAGRILLEATSLGRAAGGAPLIAVRREYVHHEGEITYATTMATEAVTEPTPHLEGVLRRVEDASSVAMTRPS